ncbi:sugar-binding transcriptional regulator [Oscillibacter sp.]|jgi:deoxyribonucleoside regulator|uniref:sugar-binding transcriptional regulator n=3 Tax=Oscillibacter TaxID=459786 RepID=UPI00216C1C8E|nr:sugar-binding domain-containing protein [Oscillibacter sp.]MCI9648127.1 hypothetical protein [Oscillibacter sp.]
MSIREDERYYLKLKALYYLYTKGLTQTEIAKMLNISRVTLGKLLEEARAEGMVRVEIVDVRNMLSLLQAEEELKQRFGLEDVKLVDGANLDGDVLMRRIAQCSAAYFEQVLRSGMKIGVTWGRTLNAMVDCLSINRGIRDLTIYTLVGSTSSSVDFQPNILAQNLLNKYGGTLKIMTAPFVCHSSQLCADIKSDPQIQSILREARELDVTMVGIGEEPVRDSARLSCYPFEEETIRSLVDHGAAGDICGNFFDITGRLCDQALQDRIVSIDIRELPCHKLVIGTGGGPQKVRSILGALNGGYLDVLITDVQTAVAVLAAVGEKGA